MKRVINIFRHQGKQMKPQQDTTTDGTEFWQGYRATELSYITHGNVKLFKHFENWSGNFL